MPIYASDHLISSSSSSDSSYESYGFGYERELPRPMCGASTLAKLGLLPQPTRNRSRNTFLKNTRKKKYHEIPVDLKPINTLFTTETEFFEGIHADISPHNMRHAGDSLSTPDCVDFSAPPVLQFEIRTNKIYSDNIEDSNLIEGPSLVTPKIANKKFRFSIEDEEPTDFKTSERDTMTFSTSSAKGNEGNNHASKVVSQLNLERSDHLDTVPEVFAEDFMDMSIHNPIEGDNDSAVEFILGQAILDSSTTVSSSSSSSSKNNGDSIKSQDQQSSKDESIQSNLEEHSKLLLSMRDTIFQQQEDLRQLASKNQQYRDRLEASHDRVQSIRREYMGSRDSIIQLQFERESFEAEALWLREELKAIRREMSRLQRTNISFDKDKNIRHNDMYQAKSFFGEVGRDDSQLDTTVVDDILAVKHVSSSIPGTTSEVRWVREKPKICMQNESDEHDTSTLVEEPMSPSSDTSQNAMNVSKRAYLPPLSTNYQSSRVDLASNQLQHSSASILNSSPRYYTNMTGRLQSSSSHSLFSPALLQQNASVTPTLVPSLSPSSRGKSVRFHSSVSFPSLSSASDNITSPENEQSYRPSRMAPHYPDIDESQTRSKDGEHNQHWDEENEHEKRDKYEIDEMENYFEDRMIRQEEGQADDYDMECNDPEEIYNQEKEEVNDDDRNGLDEDQGEDHEEEEDINTDDAITPGESIQQNSFSEIRRNPCESHSLSQFGYLHCDKKSPTKLANNVNQELRDSPKQERDAYDVFDENARNHQETNDVPQLYIQSYASYKQEYGKSFISKVTSNKNDHSKSNQNQNISRPQASFTTTGKSPTKSVSKLVQSMHLKLQNSAKSKVDEEDSEFEYQTQAERHQSSPKSRNDVRNSTLNPRIPIMTEESVNFVDATSVDENLKERHQAELFHEQNCSGKLSMEIGYEREAQPQMFTFDEETLMDRIDSDGIRPPPTEGEDEGEEDKLVFSKNVMPSSHPRQMSENRNTIDTAVNDTPTLEDNPESPRLSPRSRYLAAAAKSKVVSAKPTSIPFSTQKTTGKPILQAQPKKVKEGSIQNVGTKNQPMEKQCQMQNFKAQGSQLGFKMPNKYSTQEISHDSPREEMHEATSPTNHGSESHLPNRVEPAWLQSGRREQSLSSSSASIDVPTVTTPSNFEGYLDWDPRQSSWSRPVQQPTTPLPPYLMNSTKEQHGPPPPPPTTTTTIASSPIVQHPQKLNLKVVTTETPPAQSSPTFLQHLSPSSSSPSSPRSSLQRKAAQRIRERMMQQQQQQQKQQQQQTEENLTIRSELSPKEHKQMEHQESRNVHFPAQPSLDLQRQFRKMKKQAAAPTMSFAETNAELRWVKSKQRLLESMKNELASKEQKEHHNADESFDHGEEEETKNGNPYDSKSFFPNYSTYDNSVIRTNNSSNSSIGSNIVINNNHKSIPKNNLMFSEPMTPNRFSDLNRRVDLVRMQLVKVTLESCEEREGRDERSSSRYSSRQYQQEQIKSGRE